MTSDESLESDFKKKKNNVHATYFLLNSAIWFSFVTCLKCIDFQNYEYIYNRTIYQLKIISFKDNAEVYGGTKPPIHIASSSAKVF